ncbi:hypothetical protein QPK87_25210 [Kamptonema cortianum]|nr:hypothetical protein [Kamptonema cortianum]
MPRKPRKIPAQWKKVDLSGLQELIEKFSPSLSVTLGARRILYLFFEIIAALEERGLQLPREGKAGEWIDSLRAAPMARSLPITWMQLIEENQEQLLANPRFSSRAKELLRGSPPVASDAILVSSILDLEDAYVDGLRSKAVTQNHPSKENHEHERHHHHQCD